MAQANEAAIEVKNKSLIPDAQRRNKRNHKEITDPIQKKNVDDDVYDDGVSFAWMACGYKRV